MPVKAAQVLLFSACPGRRVESQAGPASPRLQFKASGLPSVRRLPIVHGVGRAGLRTST